MLPLNKFFPFRTTYHSQSLHHPGSKQEVTVVSLGVKCWDKIKVYTYTLKTPTSTLGLSGGAMVLGKLPVPGRPSIWITVGQGPTALAVGAGGGCLDIFTLIYPFFPLSPSLWETA